MRRTISWKARRRPLLLVALALAALAALTACGDDDGNGDVGRLRVVATTAVIGSLTTEVAGDLVRLTTLMGPGVDPHEFEPSASDLKAIRAASVVLRHGMGLDAWLDQTIQAGGARTVVTVTQGVTVRKDPETGDDDPHAWHSPAQAKVMLDNIAAALAQADPTYAGAYRQNAAAARATLDDTDRQVRTLMDSIPAANRKVVTNHDAVGYFIDYYGLTFVGAVIPGVTTQSEPSAKDLAALVELIGKEHVKAIFAESSVDPKVARQLARDTGVTIVDDLYADSLGEAGSGAETVHGMLLSNARKIAEALR